MDEHENQSITTINIAGTLPRIGTTTLALQIVRFCSTYGYHACYVEMSRQDYIWGVANVYANVATDRSSGRTLYEGIDMYGSERLDSILNGKLGPYEYVVCDFGSITDSNFNINMFAGGDCGIIVGGNKPNEIFKMQDALQDDMLSDAAIVFNFTDPADYDIIKSMMGERASDTFFMPYIPYPFKIIGNDYRTNEFFQGLMDALVRISSGTTENGL